MKKVSVAREYGGAVALITVAFLLAAAMRFVPQTTFFRDVIGTSAGAFARRLIVILPTLSAALSLIGFFCFLLTEGARCSRNLFAALILFVGAAIPAAWLWIGYTAAQVFDVDLFLISVLDPVSSDPVSSVIFDTQLVAVMVDILIVAVSLLRRSVREEEAVI